MSRMITRSMSRAMAMKKVENCEEAKPMNLLQQQRDDEATTGPVMDPRLWSHLPEHLVDRVLSFLPIPILFRLRSICKAWNSLVSSSPFLDLHARCVDSSSGRSSGPWFFLFRNQDYRETSTFDPGLNRWMNVAPPALETTSSSSPVGHQQMFLPIASANGLLCFSFCANGRTTLAVANPITRRWRELPPMLRIQTYHMAGMAVDRLTHSYKIVVVGIYGCYDVYYPTTEVFTSETNSWTITGDIPRGPLFPSRRSLLCDGVLYSWCCSAPDGLVSYDVARDSWSQIHAPMRHSLESHILVECAGGIFTVGGVRENSVTKSIRIWELHRDEMDWQEVDRMPELLCREFLRGGKRFVCIGADGLVLFVLRGRDRFVLLYDLRTKLWRRVPACPLADHRLRYGLIDGIAFQPRLDATV